MDAGLVNNADTLMACEECFDGMSYHAEQQTNDNRGKTTRLRHCRDRVGRLLVAGKHSSPFAKRVQTSLHTLRGLAVAEDDYDEKQMTIDRGQLLTLASTSLCTIRDPASGFDPAEITIFNAAHPVGVALKGVQEQMTQDIGTTCNRADTAMANTAKWLGLHDKCAMQSIGPIKLGGKVYKPIECEGGNAPWLFTLRRNINRPCPLAYPIPGVAAFFMPVKEELYALCFPIEGLLNQGIAISDYLKLTESSAGQVFVDMECKAVYVKAGEFLYVPNGWLAHTIYFNYDVKDPGLAWSHFWHYPLFCEDWVTSRERFVSAVKALNEPHLVQQGQKSKAHEERLDLLRFFFDPANRVVCNCVQAWPRQRSLTVVWDDVLTLASCPLFTLPMIC